ncbi:O-antigen ligase family protein, partial [Natrinema sp. JCM 9743]
LVFLAIYGSKRGTVASVLGLLGLGIITKIGETDAGWMSMILVLVMLGGFCLASSLAYRRLQPLRGSLASVYGIGVSILLYSERLETQDQSTGKETAVDEGQPDSTGGGAGNAGNGEPGFQEKIIDLSSNIPLVEIDTLGTRLTQYAAALELAYTYPLFGIGGYNFHLVSESYGLPTLGVHNTFFSHLAATGIPGFLAYMASVLAVLLLVSRRIYNTAEKERIFWVCGFVGLLGYHAYSFWVVIYGWQATNAGFWALSGIFVSAILFDSCHPQDMIGADI